MKASSTDIVKTDQSHMQIELSILLIPSIKSFQNKLKTVRLNLNYIQEKIILEKNK